MSRVISGLFLLVILAAPLQAEIYKCDGKWTNKPCGGKVEKQLTEQEGTEKPVALNLKSSAGTGSEPLAPRYEIIRRLDKQNRDFKAKGGITLSREEIEGFKDQCLNRETKYADCLSTFNGYSTKLVELNQNKEQIEIDQQRNMIEGQKTGNGRSKH